MDDFVISNLQEGRNEWCARLVSIFTPLVIEGFKSIFNESWKMCLDNDEVSKYLMTFQNLLCRIPKWNSNIIEDERKRIIERSGCNYLEDLITCVHIIQLKVLTSIRVGNKQKKIDISIPKLDNFIHKVYIHAARKIYMNVYLFEKNISPLQIQKNNRELELIIQECILTSIRDSIPTEAIIRAYLDESVEQEEEVFIEDIGHKEENDSKESKVESNDENNKEKTEETIELPPNKEEDIPEVVPSIKDIDNSPVITRLTFNDTDSVLDETNKENIVSAPKSIEELEKLSMERTVQRKLQEDSDDESDHITIHTEPIELSDFDVLDAETAANNISSDDPFLDFEELS
jgi:hypothetical protein